MLPHCAAAAVSQGQHCAGSGSKPIIEITSALSALVCVRDGTCGGGPVLLSHPVSLAHAAGRAVQQRSDLVHVSALHRRKQRRQEFLRGMYYCGSALGSGGSVAAPGRLAGMVHASARPHMTQSGSNHGDVPPRIPFCDSSSLASKATAPVRAGTHPTAGIGHSLCGDSSHAYVI